MASLEGGAVSTGQAGEALAPLSLSLLRPGLEQLHRPVVDHAGSSRPVSAMEATGGLHQAWVQELNQRFPGSVRLFAPRRRPPPARSWAHGGSRPTTATARR
jgi:hypothetical protein